MIPDQEPTGERPPISIRMDQRDQMPPSDAQRAARAPAQGWFLAYKLDRVIARAIGIPFAIFLWLALLSPLLILLGVLTLSSLVGGDPQQAPVVDLPADPTFPSEDAYCPDGNGGFTTPDPDGVCQGG